MGMRRRFLTVLVGAVALVFAGCDSDDGVPDTEPTTAPTERATLPLTAPPTPPAEDQAMEEIKATFEGLITAWDDSKINVSEYPSDAPGWAFEVVSSWPVHEDAQIEFENWTTAWGATGAEQVGRTIIAAHDVGDVEQDDGGNATSATSRACLDQTELRYVDYQGAPFEPPSDPAVYQTWDLEWDRTAGSWQLSDVDVTLDEPC